MSLENQGILQLYEMFVIITMIIVIFLLWVKDQNKSPSYLTEYHASLLTRSGPSGFHGIYPLVTRKLAFMS